jgi:hypothetical protein
VIELIRFALLLAIAGAAVTFFGSAAAWWWEEPRRLRRLVRKVLGGPPDAVIVAEGRNAAAGFRLASHHVVVMRDGGAHALLYRLEFLSGAELIVDDQVAARVLRDGTRQTLDQVASGARQVTLRLMFDDARHPDFSLDLWLPSDQLRKGAAPPAAAIREARGWLARAEAIMRRVSIQPPAPSANLQPTLDLGLAEDEPDLAGAEEADNEEDAAAETETYDESESPRLL